MTKENKGIDNFHPKMIQLQKEFMKEILYHVNPYTKTRYIEEPCIATLEINNENSLVSEWFRNDLENLLTPLFKKELLSQWNDWLRKKYVRTKNLAKAWNIEFPLEPDRIPQEAWSNEKIFKKLPWAIEWHDGPAKDPWQLNPKEKSVRINTDCVRKFSLANQKAVKDAPFDVRFRIRSDKAGNAVFTFVQHHAPWKNLGIIRKIATGPEWQEIQISRSAQLSDDQCRFQFQFDQGGRYEIADLSIISGGKLGLEENESLEKGNITFGTRRSATRQADISEFILDREDKYWTEMIRYLKEDLKVRVPVCAGQLEYGASYPQGKADFCDIHDYWYLASFPAKAWDMKNWYALNRPMVNYMIDRKASHASVFTNRIIGKPYTISEYNHMHQNLYAAEGLPIFASLSAFQNLSGFYAYAWSHSDQHAFLYPFLDMAETPVYLAHLPACCNM